MLAFRGSSLLFATFLLGAVSFVGAEQYQQYNDDAQEYNNYNNYNDNYNNYNNYNADDAAAQEAEEEAEQEYYYDNIYSNADYSAGDDVITYWTDYAILPKRCIV